MLNLDETLLVTSSYVLQKDFLLKSAIYSLGIVSFVDIVRNQVSEINLLQLVPGFYLILLFISFLFLVYFSHLFFSIPMENDNNKSFGTKTTYRMEKGVSMKFSLFLFLTGIVILLNTVIPISLDSFDSYGEKTLENLWSFDEVISLEIFLLVILIILSQSPLLVISLANLEKEISLFPEFWRTLSLSIFLASGFLTPTIDGYTQISFASSAVSLYLIIISLTQKRIDNKFLGTLTLSS